MHTLHSYSVHSTSYIKGSELNYEITPCALGTAFAIIARDGKKIYAADDSGSRLRTFPSSDVIKRTSSSMC